MEESFKLFQIDQENKSNCVAYAIITARNIQRNSPFTNINPMTNVVDRFVALLQLRYHAAECNTNSIIDLFAK